MCGRYTIFTEEDIVEMNAIIAKISEKFFGKPVATGEIFPTNFAPVLQLDGGMLTPGAGVWGFPKWDGKGVIINARAETALDKPTFKRPLLERRCVIPSTGFYEWRHVEGRAKKDKYLLRLPDTKILYMAGMMNSFKDAEGKPYEAFCILTTGANPSVAPVHDRMPVILQPDERERWLTDGEFMVRVLERVGPELVLTLTA